MSATTLAFTLLYFWILTTGIIGAITQKPDPEFALILSLPFLVMIVVSHVTHLEEQEKKKKKTDEQ